MLFSHNGGYNAKPYESVLSYTYDTSQTDENTSINKDWNFVDTNDGGVQFYKLSHYRWNLIQREQMIEVKH